jgi:uncharacterized protein YdaU (DUF1376 family)
VPSTPYMKLYIGDYLADTQHLSCLEHGAYCLLIFAYWQNGGPIKNDPKLLRRLMKLDARTFKKVGPAVLSMFSIVTENDKKTTKKRPDNDPTSVEYLYHRRVEKELAAREQVSTAARNAIKSRWYGRNTDVLKNGYERNTTPIVHSPEEENSKKNSKNNIPKHEYGTEKNILLTDAQYASLVASLGEPMTLACIEELSTAKAMKGYKYKRDDLAIRKWVVEAVKAKASGGNRFGAPPRVMTRTEELELEG